MELERLNFSDYCKQVKKQVVGYLNRELPKSNEYPDIINTAVRYSVFAGGKAIRSSLLFLGAQIFKPNINKNILLPVSAGIECIHNYSLIHDDLPAMDDSDVRRGRPSNHKVFGEAIAILAGDALLTHAFSFLGELGKFDEISKKTYAFIISDISRAIGVKGLIGGQVVDIRSFGKSVNSKIIDYINKTKTAALINASMRAGAALADASQDDFEKITKIATNIGLVFQLVDDILDIEGNEKELGKPKGVDSKNDKMTYATLYGVTKTRQEIERIKKESLLLIEEIKGDTERIVEMFEYLINRNK